MLNVTIKFTFYCTVILFCSCRADKKGPSEQEIQHHDDSVSEARIDSAYFKIRTACDTMMVYKVPKMVDSFLKDPALIQTFFDTGKLYKDADEKVEKVIRQLQADCDSSLLKETYRRAQFRQRSKPKQHTKAKV